MRACCNKHACTPAHLHVPIVSWLQPQRVAQVRMRERTPISVALKPSASPAASHRQRHKSPPASVTSRPGRKPSQHTVTDRLRHTGTSARVRPVAPSSSVTSVECHHSQVTRCFALSTRAARCDWPRGRPIASRRCARDVNVQPIAVRRCRYSADSDATRCINNALFCEDVVPTRGQHES